MDEMEYRLRDLDVVADHAGRLPSAAELRRRGERKRTAARARLAVATFAVVALVAGGVTAFLGTSQSPTTGTPAGPPAPVTAAPSPSTTAPETTQAPETPETSTADEVLPNVDSATLNHETGGSYWIWAPPTAADGKRQLTITGEELDLSRKNKKQPEGEWLPFYGQLDLIPVTGSESDYQITNMLNSEEANAYCVTAVEAAFNLEVCDEGDAKQAFTMTEAEGGYTISAQTQDGAYLMAEGRSITWTQKQSEATVFAMEEFDKE
jgi:hypothetical protein